MNPQFLRQRHNVVAALEPLHRYPTELLGMPSRSFLGHLQSPFPAKCASSVCLKIGVHSTEACATYGYFSTLASSSTNFCWRSDWSLPSSDSACCVMFIEQNFGPHIEQNFASL